jgi:hypothetical protein
MAETYTRGFEKFSATFARFYSASFAVKSLFSAISGIEGSSDASL